jgi:hypothetical protein
MGRQQPHPGRHGRLRRPPPLAPVHTSDGAHRQAVDITADSIIPMRRTNRTEPTPDETEAGRDDLNDDIPF